LKDCLGSSLIESQFADGLCPDWQAEDRCQYPNANCKFHRRGCRFDRWHLLSHLLVFGRTEVPAPATLS